MAGPTQLHIPLTTLLLPSFLLRNMDRFHCSARSLEFMFSTSSSLSFSSISWKAFLVRILTMTGLGSALVLSAFSMDKTWWQKWPKEVVTHHNTHTQLFFVQKQSRNADWLLLLKLESKEEKHLQKWESKRLKLLTTLQPRTKYAESGGAEG